MVRSIPAPDQVLSRITADDVVKLTLDLCNIPSPYGRERAAAEFVFEWLRAAGFSPRYLALVEDRPNVVARLRGTGGGHSLIFNSHLDTAFGPEETLRLIDANLPIYNQTWVDGDEIYGEGVVNDKGPMAAFLIAAKAILEAGITLPGDLWLTAVVGEIGQEPVDEFQGPQYLSKEAGTRFVVTHGVVGDYALVAEGTDFAPIWVEAGKAFFKITFYYRDKPIYTPFMEHPDDLRKAPNAILHLGPFLERFEAWARDYQQRHRYDSPGGTVVARASVNAVRGGVPYHMISSSQLCSVYVDVRLLPDQSPLSVREELEALIAELGLDGDVELYLFRRGYESRGIELLHDALMAAHRSVIRDTPGHPHPGISSMWRDINVFSELGIPSITYGPPRAIMKTGYQIDALVNAAKVYALLALSICTRPRGARTRR